MAQTCMYFYVLVYEGASLLTKKKITGMQDEEGIFHFLLLGIAALFYHHLLVTTIWAVLLFYPMAKLKAVLLWLVLVSELLQPLLGFHISVAREISSSSLYSSSTISETQDLSTSIRFESLPMTVYLEDTDAYGIMFNTNYLRSYDRALHLTTSNRNLNTSVTSQHDGWTCLLYTSPSPRDATLSRMPSSA